MGFQCDKLATELSVQFASRRKSPILSNRARIQPTETPLTRFNLPHLHLAPPLRVTTAELCRNFRHQKTRVLGLSCGVVCVILRLVVTVEYRLVTDGRTDGETDRHTVTANTRASHSVARVKTHVHLLKRSKI